MSGARALVSLELPRYPSLVPRPRSLVSSLSLLLLLACPAKDPTPSEAPVTEPAQQPAPEPQIGERATHLVGELALPNGNRLGFAIELSGTAEKFDAAKLWIPMQGLTGQPFDELEDHGAKLFLRWNAAGVAFTVDYSDGLSCAFMQMAVPVECSVEAVEPEAFAEAITPERPQNPKPPFPYASEDVEIANTQAEGVTLAGTLTIPEGPGPHPAVVLISGSGAQDRDESLLGHKPFWVLADHLSRQGIAVLRYDDRGFAKSTGDAKTGTTEDFASDAWAVVEYLRSRPEIDAKKIGLIGHSEGGLVGPKVAAAHPKEIAFVVMLAGTGVRGDVLIRHQAMLIAKASGADQATLERDDQIGARMYEAALLDPPEQAKATLEAVLKEWAAGLSPQELQGLGGNVEAAVAQQLTIFQSPWMRYFLAYDPVPTLKKLKMPVLAVNGEKDLQVDPDQNLPPIEKALARNKKAKVVELPGLNHLFQPATTGLPAEYATIDTTIDPSLLDIVATWIREQTGLTK